MTRKDGFRELDEPRPVWSPEWDESSQQQGPCLPGASPATVLCARNADDEEEDEEFDYFYDDEDEDDLDDDFEDDLEEEFDEDEEEPGDDEDL